MLHRLCRLGWLGTLACLAQGLRPEASTGGVSVGAAAHMQLDHHSRSGKPEQLPAASNQTVEDLAKASSSDSGNGATPDTQQNKSVQDFAKASSSDTRNRASPRNRTNVCAQMKLVSEGKLKLGNALSGLSLTVATREGANNFLYRDGDTWSGYDYQVLNEVATRAGFDFTIVSNDLQNEDVNLWLKDTVQMYDLNLDHRSQAYPRELQRMALLYPFLDSSVVLVLSEAPKMMDSSMSLSVLLKPYDTQVWLVFVAVCFLTCGSYWYVERNQKADDNPDREHADERSLGGALYILLQHLATVRSLTPTSGAGQVIAVSWSLVSLIFVAGYVANLASCLMEVRKSSATWTSIDDVMADDARICVSAGATQWYMKDNFPNYGKVVVDNVSPIRNMVVNGKCEAALDWKLNYDISSQKEDLNPNCTLRQVGRRLTDNYAGWTVMEDYMDKCTALVHDVIRTTMIGMDEDGTFTKLSDKYLMTAERTRRKPCDNLDVEHSQELGLPLSSIAGLFMFHTAVLFAATVTMAFLSKPAGVEGVESSQAGRRESS